MKKRKRSRAAIVSQGPMRDGDIIGGFTPPPPDEETRRVFRVVDDPYPVHFAHEAMREALSREPGLVLMPLPDLREAEQPMTRDDISAALRRAIFGDDTCLANSRSPNSTGKSQG